MFKILVFVLIVIGVPAYAQNDTTGIVIHKDPRIDLLVKKQIEINESTTRSARRFAPGFRVLVMNTNNRQKVQEAKTKIYQRYPDQKTYMTWQAPFFKLKVGNFRNREEAEEFLNELKTIFPTGIYLIRETVEVRPEDN